MRSTKFFGMVILSTYVFMSAFGPNTTLGQIHFRSLWKQFVPDSDCFKDSDYPVAMIGADQVAVSVMYMILFYHRLWMVGGAITLIDCTYYGLFGLNAPSVAAFAALTML